MTFTVDHLRDVLFQLEEQASGYRARGLFAPSWLHTDIAWFRNEIARMT